MEFEPLIKEMEEVMMPELKRRHDAISGDSRFADARVVSIRHAEGVHTIALGCHPIKSLSPHDRYSISVNIFDHDGLFMRGFATWSQPYINFPTESHAEAESSSAPGYLAGYTIREAMTRSFHLRPGRTVEDFTVLLPPLYRAFDRGIKRGHPPGGLRQFWNRLFTWEK